jgi:hypothetical protein
VLQSIIFYQINLTTAAFLAQLDFAGRDQGSGARDQHNISALHTPFKADGANFSPSGKRDKFLAGEE